MSITVATSNPAGLLAAIRKAIDDKEIETWSYDTAGDFTHTPSQWKFQAWMTPIIRKNELVFGIIGRSDTKMSKEVYGVYHGRFIEMLLAHFDQQFDDAKASALITLDDRF